jgi:hypothetical protein
MFETDALGLRLQQWCKDNSSRNWRFKKIEDDKKLTLEEERLEQTRERLRRELDGQFNLRNNIQRSQRDKDRVSQLQNKDLSTVTLPDRCLSRKMQDQADESIGNKDLQSGQRDRTSTSRFLSGNSKRKQSVSAASPQKTALKQHAYSSTAANHSPTRLAHQDGESKVSGRQRFMSSKARNNATLE